MRGLLVTPTVEAVGVSFTYGDYVAIKPSTFEIPPGAITALIGPNGSGKSTLLNGIAGLTKPASGELTVAPKGSRRISYVLQGTKVNDALPVTVREVVAMGRYAGKHPFERLTRHDRAAVDAAMQRMSIADISNHHLAELSGGQRQRVFVAQGLAQEHDILLLDEPTTGLDLVSAQAIDEVIRDERNRGCTVIMTTHELTEARNSDHVLLVSQRVVAWGSPSEVLTVENLTEAYGATLLEVDGERLFLDDPHHDPVEGRHTHERSIHVDSSATDTHPPHQH